MPPVGTITVTHDLPWKSDSMKLSPPPLFGRLRSASASCRLTVPPPRQLKLLPAPPPSPVVEAPPTPRVKRVSLTADGQPRSSPRAMASSAFVLFLLYMVRGIPIGLVVGSLPFVLKANASYAELGLLSVSTLPSSVSILWSPIVDTYFSSVVGRRRSWIIPCVMLSGFTFLGASMFMDSWVDSGNVTAVALIMLLITFLTATNDIAVDAWALHLLPDRNGRSYASTLQNTGNGIGQLLSFPLLLALLNPDLCNAWLRPPEAPLAVGVLSLSSFFWCWGWVLLTLGIYVAYVKTDDEYITTEVISLKSVFSMLLRLGKLPHLRALAALLITWPLAYVVIETVFILKLMDVGLKQENLMALFGLQTPLQVLLSVLVARRIAGGAKPLRLWFYGFLLLVLSAGLFPLLVSFYPSGGFTADDQAGFWACVVGAMVVMSILSLALKTISTSTGAFFNLIVDPAIGGTYLTLLNTLNNLGRAWPRPLAFLLTDLVGYFNVAFGSCILGLLLAYPLFKLSRSAGKPAATDWHLVQEVLPVRQQHNHLN